MSLLLDFAIKTFSGLVIAGVAAGLAARWAIGKFYAEKRWERKEQAYIEIIDAMYDIKIYSSIQQKDYGQGTGYSDEKMSDFFDKYIQSLSFLSKVMGIGSLYISKEAQKILDDFAKRDLPDQTENPKWEYYEEQFKISSTTLEKIIEIAKKELSLK